MTSFFLVRHASAESNGLDPSLTTRGRAEASALAQRLRGRTFDAFWSSDLARAAETAETLLAGRTELPLRKSPLLREVEAPPEGLLSGDPAGYAAWERKITADLAEKLSEWLRTAADAERNSPHDSSLITHHSSLLVVSHAGPLRVLICLLVGLPPEAHWSFRIDHASLSIVERGEGMGTILLLNDRCHLDIVLSR